MKKYIGTCVLVLLSMVSIVWNVRAESEERPTPGSKASFFIRNDVIVPDEGSLRSVQWFNAYGQLNSVGLGLDVISCQTSKPDSLQVRPYATFNVKGPWSLVAGGSFGDAGDFVDFGYWYVNSFHGFDVFLDHRFYAAFHRDSYVDLFSEISHRLGESNWSVGVDLVYDKWLEGPDHDWLLMGIPVKYQVNKNFSIVGRVAHTWTFYDGKSSEDNQFRVDLKYNFF